MYRREERFELRYVRDGVEKVCYPRSKEQKEKNLAICKEHGYKVLSCKKLYPFSMERNQHNFELVSNVCRNRMSDMIDGEIPFDSDEYEELMRRAERADEFFCRELPVAWMSWDELCEAKEICAGAILHRQEACLAAGRPDLVALCAD